jgi:hypothetical protein
MHGMVTQKIIIKRHVQKHCSIRQLAREYHMSRKTIRKMLSQGSRVPKYTLTKDRPCPVMDPFWIDKHTLTTSASFLLILWFRLNSRSRSLCVPGSDIVVGECSFASRRAGAGTGRAGKPQPRTWLAEVCGDGSEQQSKGAVSPTCGAEGTRKRRLPSKGTL